MKKEEKNLPIAAEALRASYGTAAILPIEFFKLHAETLRDLIPAPVARSFLSSGTTRADRSQSHFSKAGLTLYHEKSVEGFQDVLRHFFPEPLTVKGLSLIPDIHEWPDSSLAQMVHWIGEVHELRYWDGQSPVPDEPVWVFGTAFHFVNLADDGLRMRLPAGSLVIETGGTKGRSRSVTRDELYDLIVEHLGVPKNRIISEYGMCELASQAYDFVACPDGPELPLQERWFRFPDDTAVRVRDRLSQEQTAGEGTLVIYDNLRVDYPWPIRTEDMARVRHDGAFQLLGRVPMSPLKGCSMLAEQIGVESAFQPMTPAPDTLLIKGAEPGDRSRRAAQVHRLAQGLLHDEVFWDHFRAELEHTRAVEWLREDLRRSLPLDEKVWLKAAENAWKHGSPRRWLIIPPETHSFAWLYPILLGAVLGLDLHLRAKAQDRLVQRLQTLLTALGGFQVWDAHKRIGIDPLPAVDSVMIFGSDETIAAIRKISPVPVQGFGSTLTVSIMQADDEPTAVWKDAFSLLQRGCMSSRVVFLMDRELPQLPLQPIGPLPLGVELALEHAAFALRCQGVDLSARIAEGSPLTKVQTFDPQESLSDLLLDRAMSLSLIHVPRNLWPAFAEWLPAQKNLHKIAIHGRPVEIDAARFEIVEPGQANAPDWNGFHQSRPLFEYNKQDEIAESKGNKI